MPARISVRRFLTRSAALASFALLFLTPVLRAQFPPTTDPPSYGPYNAVFLSDGDGLTKHLLERDSVLRADSPWTLYCWFRSDAPLASPALVAGLGTPAEEYPRYLAAANDKLLLWMGQDNSLEFPANLAPGTWHFIAATFDGVTDFALYADGERLGAGKLYLGTVSPILMIAPANVSWAKVHHFEGPHFAGRIAGLSLLRRTLTPDEIRQLHETPADLSIIPFEQGSKPWPIQTRQQAGYRAPQDPDTMPKSKAPFSRPAIHPLTPSPSPLQPAGESQWTLAGGWTLAAAPDIPDDGAALSQPGFRAAALKPWLAATVPGTVLTTLIDRGVYPDPDYGLNNLAIPESLNKQDYWYRVEFKAPASLAGRHSILTFHGINYKAVVWLNGHSLGTITGAFIRGAFDVTGILKPGQLNALAVRVSPPPHPGIPQEQSIKGGPGENGGIMCLDGPTFVATEGWDWIPAIRDRDTGIWQPVTLAATGEVKIGDPQVVTTLPLPDTSRADLEIAVPLDNTSSAPVHGTLHASFEQTSITKDVILPPGENSVVLLPAEFPQLTVQHPRLWWPNGYGAPALYHLKLAFTENGAASDTKQVTFGIREITYELSLLDSSGHLRRVDYSPAITRAKNESPSPERVVDVSHYGMREIPPADPPPPWFPESPGDDWHSWVASLAPGGESSPAIRTLTSEEDAKSAPYLVIKVNGVRIACRGGNWGTDDSRKRVSRERLEPYFRLHRDANVNIIRNWVGQNTEETFYELADEYGLLVWNDFWASTQNYNVEPEDPAPFLANARDTILRFRNHPSIVMWCGRNEGVPQPVLNEGLDELVRTLDGTRYYSPSSNQINLQGSGPYMYQDPKLYYTTLNHGFSVETGTPSMATLESFQAWIPKPDQWPIDDVWAYHDWHFSQGGDIHPFMAEVEAEFGAATSLEDFERKAQMLNYVDHRAIFEGMNAHLWAPNSGRMLWMTQPAWPSTMWQILTHDYDTQASYYGVKKACERVHVQLDLSNYNVDIVNTTTTPLSALTVTANVFSLDNKSLLHHQETKDAPADAESDAFNLDLTPLLRDGVVLVKLELRNSAGELLSDNFYWLGAESSSYRQLNHLPPANLEVTATLVRAGDGSHVRATLANRGNSAVLAAKLTLLNADDGSRILPAYYSDNYVSLLPGEARTIDIEYPDSAAQRPMKLALRAWNLASETVPVSAAR